MIARAQPGTGQNRRKLARSAQPKPSKLTQPSSDMRSACRGARQAHGLLCAASAPAQARLEVRTPTCASARSLASAAPHSAHKTTNDIRRPAAPSDDLMLARCRQRSLHFTALCDCLAHRSKYGDAQRKRTKRFQTQPRPLSRTCSSRRHDALRVCARVANVACRALASCPGELQRRERRACAQDIARRLTPAAAHLWKASESRQAGLGSMQASSGTQMPFHLTGRS